MENRIVKCQDLNISNSNKICLIAGPCQLETEQHALDMAGEIKKIADKYNIGLIYSNNGEYVQALEYYQQALELNSNLPQALNNIAVIYHYQGSQAIEKQNTETSKALFDKAGEYWRQAIRLAPTNYIEAQNWLKTTGRISSDLI